MIRIITSSKDLGLVVAIHLDHIGVRVYISQFTHTKFINVVIKFRTPTSATVKQKLVLDAISPISLCKSGCGRSELVDLEATLKAAGIDTTQPEKGVLQEVDISKEVDENEDDDDYDKDVGSDDLMTGVKDQNGEPYYYYDDEEYDDSQDDAIDVKSGALMQPQKDPRAKRVKKDADTSILSPRKNRNKKNKDRKKKDRKNKPDSNPVNNNGNPSLNHNAPSASALSAFFLLKPSASMSKSSSASSSSILSPPVPLGQITSIISSPDRSSSTVAAPSFPHLQDQLIQNDLIPLHKPTLTDECNEMIGFYRLACLYDTVLKGIASNYPHKYASSFDEPRLPESMINSDDSLKTNIDDGTSSAPTLAHLSNSLILLLLIITTLRTICFQLWYLVIW